MQSNQLIIPMKGSADARTNALKQKEPLPLSPSNQTSPQPPHRLHDDQHQEGIHHRDQLI